MQCPRSVKRLFDQFVDLYGFVRLQLSYLDSNSVTIYCKKVMQTLSKVIYPKYSTVAPYPVRPARPRPYLNFEKKKAAAAGPYLPWACWWRP